MKGQQQHGVSSMLSSSSDSDELTAIFEPDLKIQ
jgi:hypothetical protein